MMSYGPAFQEDAVSLAALHAESFARGWSRDEFAGLLKGEENCAYVARRAEDKRPVGFVIAHLAADEAEITTVAVSPQHRRQGVARKLMEHLLDALGRRGVAAVFLEVGAENSPALRLYRDLGFAEIGARPGYYRGTVPGDALVLRAVLAPPPVVSKTAETD